MPLLTWTIFLLFLFLPSPSQAKQLNLAQSSASWIGEANYDNAGIAISSAGDVNGDGYEDILIGAQNNDESGNNAGKVYLFWGREQGWSRGVNLAQADVSFVGEVEYDNAGIAVAYAGDVNGDGYADFLIGAPNNDERGENTGKVYLFFGKKGGWPKKIPLSQADVSLLGEQAGDNAGNALSFAGDVNGDGYADFLIGAKNNDGGGDNAGKCYLVLGKASGWDRKVKLAFAASFIGEDPDDKAGESVAFAGDMNGDGYDDFLIGAPASRSHGPESGKAYLILGRADGFAQNLDLSRVDASFVGTKAASRAGSALSFVGDVNQDGLSDFLIAAEGNSERGKGAGKCFLFFGRRKGWQKNTPLGKADVFLFGEKKGDHFGSAVAYAGDMEGQGREGFVIGANRNDQSRKNAGKVYFFPARSSWPQEMEAGGAPLTFLGEAKYDYAGNRLAYLGDTDGDGLPEFLVGADSSNKGGRQAGQVYLVSGKRNKPPLNVNKLSFKSDASFSRDLTTQVEAGDWLYLQAEGEDAQAERRDVLRAIARTHQANAIKIQLVESEADSGIYRGKFQLAATGSNQLSRRLAVKTGDTVAILLKDSPEPYATVSLKVSYYGYIIDDDKVGSSSGNNNGYLEAGEAVELGLILANNYFQDLTGVTARLSSDDPQVNALRGELSFGAIASKQRQTSRNQVLVVVSPNCPPGHLLTFRLTIKSKSGLQWEDSFTLPVEKMINISGRLRDSLTNLPLQGGTISLKGKKLASTSGDGRYSIYLAQGAVKETLVLSAPGHLSLKREVECSGDQKLDFALVPRQVLSIAPVAFGGENAYDSSGDALSYAGDVNGDGYDDFLIGAWANDDGGLEAGKVYLIFGRPGGWDKRFDLTRVDASFIGEARYDEAGRTLAYAGDVNGDGYDDFLIGAPNNDAGGDKTGQTYLFLGKPDGWQKDVSMSSADASFIGQENHDRAGSALSYAGDVNGDGYDDFLIGAWANDANGDDAGAVYLILGKAEGWKRQTPLTRADASWVGEAPRNEAGKAVAYAGDVNGDGYDDFLIGAPANGEGKDFAGKSFLIMGRSFGFGWQVGLNQTDASFLGEDTNDSSGSRLGYIGDVNGDGLSDFAISAWASDANQADAGQVYIFFGSKKARTPDQSLSSADASFVGENPGDAAGLSFSPAGDVNGDGYDDFLIGAWRNKDKGVEAGQSYLILGKTSGWARHTNLAFAARSFMGKSSGSASGRVVSYAGDVNGDGYDDFLIGAKGEDTKGLDAGETYLLLASPNSPPRSISSLALTVKDDLSDPRNPYQGIEIELIGVDADPQRANVAEVLLTSTSWPHLLKLRLHENAANSGVYQGTVRITSTASSQFERRLLAHGTAVVTVSAKDDGAVYQQATIKDISPPFITRMLPGADEGRAPIGGQINLHLKDLGSGVDKDSITLRLNEKQVTPQISGGPDDYKLSYDPPQRFAFAQQIDIRVQAQDLSSPPHRLDTGYSFRAADAGVLFNPGFEKGFSQWFHSDTQGAVTSLDSNISYSGRNSVRIDFTGRQDINYNHLYQGPIPVQPNTSYLLTAYMKSEGINTLQGVRLYVEGSSQPGRVAGDDPGFFNDNSGQLWDTNDWSKVTVSFTTLEETRYVYVYAVRWTSGEAIYGRCWTDDFYLMEESEPGFQWQRIKGNFIEFFR